MEVLQSTRANQDLFPPAEMLLFPVMELTGRSHPLPALVK